MTGKKIAITHMHNHFINEAFRWKNARGKKYSFDKADLKRALRKFRYNKDFEKEDDEL